MENYEYPSLTIPLREEEKGLRGRLQALKAEKKAACTRKERKKLRKEIRHIGRELWDMPSRLKEAKEAEETMRHDALWFFEQEDRRRLPAINAGIFLAPAECRGEAIYQAKIRKKESDRKELIDAAKAVAQAIRDKKEN